MILYSLYDIKGKEYMPPFVAHDDYDAKRSVWRAYVGMSEDALLRLFPADYQIIRLGEVNADGVLVPASAADREVAFVNDLAAVFVRATACSEKEEE